MSDIEGLFIRFLDADIKKSHPKVTFEMVPRPNLGEKLISR